MIQPLPRGKNTLITPTPEVAWCGWNKSKPFSAFLGLDIEMQTVNSAVGYDVKAPQSRKEKRKDYGPMGAHFRVVPCISSSH